MEDKVPIVQLRNVSKSFGNQHVLQPIDLDIYEGEFLTILGSSGCGKTTTLRIIAGFEEPSSGQVLLENKDVTKLPPYNRNVNTVFQSYALFPHMTVFDNVAFGLVEKKIPKAEIKQRVLKALDMVQLNKFEKRKPDKLSGGQKQRVAIARAIVNNPKVLLLDEPLGALDLKLRKQMQLELKHLQQQLGITFIYVTHDQEEALTMSDRIVIMNKGNLEQIGTPKEIYEKPRTKFVADFIGESNIFEASVEKINENDLTLMLENGHAVGIGDGFKKDEIVYVCVRPENIKITTDKVPGFTIKGRVRDHVYVGSVMKTVVDLPNDMEVKVAHHPDEKNCNIGDLVTLYWNPEKAVIMHTTEDNIYDLIEDAVLKLK